MYYVIVQSRMRFDPHAVRGLAELQGMSLSEVLRRAGVSRTAFYSLARRSTPLPKTITSLAASLGVSPRSLLRDEPRSVRARPEALLREARAIRSRNSCADFQNVWHTLNLLELEPAERLARSLVRGRARAVQR
jgi:transcriptional regulator with XRE-family HTH domain